MYNTCMMNFDFKSFWNSDSNKKQRERAEIFVNALVALGMSETEAIAMVSEFQQCAFEDGEGEEAFNNCGEDA